MDNANYNLTMENLSTLQQKLYNNITYGSAQEVVGTSSWSFEKPESISTLPSNRQKRALSLSSEDEREYEIGKRYKMWKPAATAEQNTSFSVGSFDTMSVTEIENVIGNQTLPTSPPPGASSSVRREIDFEQFYRIPASPYAEPNPTYAAWVARLEHLKAFGQRTIDSADDLNGDLHVEIREHLSSWGEDSVYEGLLAQYEHVSEKIDAAQEFWTRNFATILSQSQLAIEEVTRQNRDTTWNVFYEQGRE